MIMDFPRRETGEETGDHVTWSLTGPLNLSSLFFGEREKQDLLVFPSGREKAVLCLLSNLRTPPPPPPLPPPPGGGGWGFFCLSKCICFQSRPLCLLCYSSFDFTINEKSPPPEGERPGKQGTVLLFLSPYSSLPQTKHCRLSCDNDIIK